MSEMMIGPRLSDAVFFNELVDTTLPGMEGLAEAAAAGEYALCRQIFAKRVRDHLRVDLYEKLGGDVVMRAWGGEQDPLEEADKVCRNLLISCGTPYQYGEEIDWTFNATANGYVEWTWQLNRHPHWRHLAKAYKKTGDEKYAECFARQFAGWVKQAVAPEKAFGNQTLCWRTIETGLRMSGAFPEVLHTFYKSPAFTDDILVDFYKSVWEHGNRLEKDHMRANWLIMEMNGLGHIALMYPELKDAARWYNFVIEILKRELKEQIYPDGFQAELSTSYQFAVIGNYMGILHAAEKYERPMPRELYDGVEKMLELFVKLVKPDGVEPNIGDGHGMALTTLTGAFIKDFPNNQLLRWAATGGKEGTAPDYNSIVLPYSGTAALRTGWGEDALYATFDGGPYGMSHQHQDKLNLTVYANGKYILPEAGTYAYDTSEMRAYVLSTRAHNTVRVNGMDQNRQQEFKWDPASVQELSGMEWNLGETVDMVSAVYDEGYNNGSTETAFPKDGLPPVDPATLPVLYKGAKHSRRVMLVKKPPQGLKPFLLVADRLESEDENDYEILWHLDADKVDVDGMNVRADDFTLMTPEMPMETLGLAMVRGASSPEWQGWMGNTMMQGEYRPIWTAKTMLHGTSLRCVTLLYPAGEDCPIAAVEASADVNDTAITLVGKNGEIYTFDETVQ